MRRENSMDITTFLKNTPLLQGIALPMEGVYPKEMEKGEFVSDDNCVVFVYSGSISVCYTTLDGRNIHINTLVPGQCFGISNLFDASELSTTMQCLTPTSLVLVPKETVRKAVEESSDLAIRYATFCNKKIDFLIQKLDFLTTSSGRGKVMKYLITFQDSQGKLPVKSRDELASHIGISRATLFRELGYLKEKGFITLDEKSIMVVKEEDLRELLLQCH